MEGFSTPRELAQESGWSEKRIRDLIAAKQLRHIRVRSRFFIPKGAIHEFIARNMVEPERPESKFSGAPNADGHGDGQ